MKFSKKEINYLFVLRDLPYFLLYIYYYSLIKKLLLSDYSMEFSVEYRLLKYSIAAALVLII